MAGETTSTFQPLLKEVYSLKKRAKHPAVVPQQNVPRFGRGGSRTVRTMLRRKKAFSRPRTY